MTKPEADNTLAPTDDSFFSRWSRRKQAVQNESINTLPEPEQTHKSAVAEPRELCDADMPPIDTLSEDSDYRGFLSPRVSEALRRQALHKLFHGASFNIRDGLDDYDEEYTHFAKLGDIVTSDMRHQLEVEAQRLRELVETEPQVPTQNPSTASDSAESPLACNEATVPDVEVHDVEIES